MTCGFNKVNEDKWDIEKEGKKERKKERKRERYIYIYRESRNVRDTMYSVEENQGDCMPWLCCLSVCDIEGERSKVSESVIVKNFGNDKSKERNSVQHIHVGLHLDEKRNGKLWTHVVETAWWYHSLTSPTRFP